MMRRVVAGLVGAMLGLLPVALVDAVVTNPSMQGELAPATAQQLLLVGAVALVGGVLLGGGVAGWIAGRKDGVGAGGMAGTLAAVVYAGSLIGVILRVDNHGQHTFTFVQVHPLRSSVAIALVSTVIIVVALIASRIVSPPAPVAPSRAQDAQMRYAPPPAPRYGLQNQTPSASTTWQPAASRPREQVSAPRSRQSRSAPRYPR